MGNRRRLGGKVSGNCPKCGIYREFLAIDHVIPSWKFRAGIVFGNPNAIENIQYICDNCHADKTRREMETENPAKRIESRKKIKEGIQRTGWKPTAEWRAKQSHSHKGLTASDETKAKITQANKIAWATKRQRKMTEQQKIDRTQRMIDRLRANMENNNGSV